MERAGGAFHRRSAISIAGIYAILGGLWIFLSDRVVQAIATSQAQLTLFQTVKGGVFILLSSTVIYGLANRSFSRLTAKNRELEGALQQANRLHRILRHNLRNSCQIIAGNVELLTEQLESDHEPQLDAIRTRNDQLIELSRKSIFFHDFLDVEAAEFGETDLVATVRAHVDEAERTHPEVAIATDLPDRAVAYAHKHIDGAVEELIENAIIHNGSTEPRVWVTVRTTPETVIVRVKDNGPGLPPIERRVLERKKETPIEHSQGLGLWLVYLTVHHSNGSLTVDENRHGGAEIRFSLPAA